MGLEGNESTQAPLNQLSGNLTGHPGKIREVTVTVPFPDSYVYSNCSAYSVSFMDIRISFGETSTEDKVTSKVGIVMPPEHAAHVCMALLQQLAVFERSFGPIRNPLWRRFMSGQMDEALAGVATPEGQAPLSQPPTP